MSCYNPMFHLTLAFCKGISMSFSMAIDEYQTFRLSSSGPSSLPWLTGWCSDWCARGTPASSSGCLSEALAPCMSSTLATAGFPFTGLDAPTGWRWATMNR